MARDFNCSHYFVYNHYALFDSEVNSSNATMRAWSKYYCLCICTYKAHFVQYHWDVFLLEIVQMCVR